MVESSLGLGFDKNASVITDQFLIGNMEASKDLKFLQNSGITHIVNCAYQCSNHFPGKFKYLHLRISDLPSTNIFRFFKEAIQFLEEASRDKKNKILVHCIAGHSRSVTILTGFLMFQDLQGAESVLKMIQEKRKGANPNSGFLKQLEIFGMILAKLNEKEFPDKKAKVFALKEKLGLISVIGVHELEKELRKLKE